MKRQNTKLFTPLFSLHWQVASAFQLHFFFFFQLHFIFYFLFFSNFILKLTAPKNMTGVSSADSTTGLILRR